MQFFQRYRVLVLVPLLLLWVVPAVAQTLGTDAPTDQKVYEIFLKVLFPTLWTAVVPFFTKYVSMGIQKVFTVVPAAWQVVISTVLGALTAAVAGSIPSFPLGVESAITMGATGGATGQLLANMKPGTVQPEPEKK